MTIVSFVLILVVAAVIIYGVILAFAGNWKALIMLLVCLLVGMWILSALGLKLHFDLIGFVLPPVIDLINKRITDSRVRYIVSFLVCMLVGAALNFNQLKTGSIQEALESTALIFAAASTTYKLYWKESTVRSSFLK